MVMDLQAADSRVCSTALSRHLWTKRLAANILGRLLVVGARSGKEPRLVPLLPPYSALLEIDTTAVV